MIASDHGLVLRVHKLRETSKIVSLFGRAEGRVRLVAHGGRGPHHRFGASLQVGNEVDAVFVLAAGRDLGTLREAALRQAWIAGAGRLEAVATGLAVIELLDRVLPDGARDEGLYADALAALARVTRAPGRAAALGAFYGFELTLLARLGLRPDLTACTRCERPAGHGPAVLELHAGRLACATCVASGPGRLALSPEVAAALAALDAGDTRLDAARTRRAVGLVLHRLLGIHIEAYRYPRSLALLKKVDIDAASAG
jgi:DNA repair protein RecO (recombination protein O)